MQDEVYIKPQVHIDRGGFLFFGSFSPPPSFFPLLFIVSCFLTNKTGLLWFWHVSCALFILTRRASFLLTTCCWLTCWSQSLLDSDGTTSGQFVLNVPPPPPPHTHSCLFPLSFCVSVALCILSGLSVSVLGPRSGVLQTQKLRPPLLRSQSSTVLPLKPGVVRNIAVFFSRVHFVR